MDKKSFTEFGIDIEQGFNENTMEESPSENFAEPQQKKRDSRLLFSEFTNFGVTPELEDQLNALAVDPKELLRGLRKTGFNVVEISDEEQKKFGMKDHPLHEEYLRKAS
jgi:hypothetical protein